ncbi:MAG: HD domain-containing protein [Trueperaceae bacterium]
MSADRDLAGAVRYAREAADRLPTSLCYHDRAHTFDVVVPAARRLAIEERLDAGTRALVMVAACYHDLGFVEAYEGHEEVSQRLAAEALPRFGFRGAEVDAVVGMIAATRLPQSPRTLAERVLADADLIVLGRRDFLSFDRLLRREAERRAGPIGDIEWYGAQLAFLAAHRYFTPTARRMRERRKQLNRVQLGALMERAQRSGSGVS